MQNECPNCKCDKSAFIKSDCIYHQGTGTLYPSICLRCGVIYVDEDRLKRIREIEGFNDDNL